MYDPTVGRWLSEDPIGFEGGDNNLYRYVANNPTDVRDASGLDPYVPPIRTDLKEYEMKYRLGGWDPKDFLFYALGSSVYRGLFNLRDTTQWLHVKRGCIGLCELRTGSYLDIQPETKVGRMPHRAKGVRIFKELSDATSFKHSTDYYNDLSEGKKPKSVPVLFAIQSVGDFIKDTRTLRNSRYKSEIDPDSVHLGKWAFNFATEFTDKTGCFAFWEWIPGGLGLTPDAKVRHTKNLPKGTRIGGKFFEYKYTVYGVAVTTSKYAPEPVPSKEVERIMKEGG